MQEDYPELLTSVPLTYTFKETGVTKAGLPPPPEVDAIPWWAFWDDGAVIEVRRPGREPVTDHTGKLQSCSPVSFAVRHALDLHN